MISGAVIYAPTTFDPLSIITLTTAIRGQFVGVSIEDNDDRVVIQLPETPDTPNSDTRYFFGYSPLSIEYPDASLRFVSTYPVYLDDVLITSEYDAEYALNTHTVTLNYEHVIHFSFSSVTNSWYAATTTVSAFLLGNTPWSRIDKTGALPSDIGAQAALPTPINNNGYILQIVNNDYALVNELDGGELT
jgi:hypothetical protein